MLAPTVSATLSRRSLLAMAATSPTLWAASKGKRPPIGLELFSVREELRKDLFATVGAVAKMGYDGVEFFSPYFDWTPAYAKDVRKLLDDLGIRCFSTHNGGRAFEPEQVAKAIELNQILGSRYIVMASAGKVPDLDGWKKVAARLNEGAAAMKPAGIRAGFHNHKAEFVPIDGVRPMDVLAKNTDKSVVLQLDIGTCLDAGADPIVWVKAHPGRIVSMHCKDWSPDPAKGYQVLVGEGATPWKPLLAAAEKTGGLEYYLVEQEGSRFSELETAERCLASFRKLLG